MPSVRFILKAIHLFRILVEFPNYTWYFLDLHRLLLKNLTHFKTKDKSTSHTKCKSLCLNHLSFVVLTKEQIEKEIKCNLRENKFKRKCLMSVRRLVSKGFSIW